MRLPWQKFRTLNRILIDESALRHNLAVFRHVLPGKSVCPVLKSNAYGHGLTLVAKILDTEHCDFFCVDSLYEAYELQKAKIKTPILILGTNFEENLRRGLPFHFTANDLNSLEVLQKHRLPVHLKINTGFNRFGFHWRNFEEDLRLIQKINPKIEGIFTHLADADAIDNTRTEEQVERFEKVLALLHKAGFNPKWVHVGNSAGALKTPDTDFNMLRIGIGLYGINPYDPKDPYYSQLAALKPVLEFRSTLVEIQTLKKGDRVGYKGTYEAPGDEVIGVISASYYEGIPRSLSNKGLITLNGSDCPIVGTVCMNYTMISLKGLTASVGDEVLVYSKDPGGATNLNHQAHKAGTIPYELLTGLSESVKRQVQ